MSEVQPYRRGANLQDAPRCKAKSKRTGLPCTQAAMANGCCRFHGGKSLSGIHLPQFKGKGYSKHIMPFDLLEAVKNLENNEELLNLTEEIQLVTARIQTLLPKLKTGEAHQRWREVKTHWRALRSAQRREDRVTMAEAAASLDHLLSEADQDYKVWDDIYKALTMQERLINREQKRRMDMNALVSTDQAVGFVAEVVEIVKKHVTDPDLLEAIYHDVMKAMTKRPGMMQNQAPNGG